MSVLAGGDVIARAEEPAMRQDRHRSPVAVLGARLALLLLDDRHAMAGMVLGVALLVSALAASDLIGVHWLAAK